METRIVDNNKLKIFKIIQVHSNTDEYQTFLFDNIEDLKNQECKPLYLEFILRGPGGNKEEFANSNQESILHTEISYG